jgi:hypothetical protein
MGDGGWGVEGVGVRVSEGFVVGLGVGGWGVWVGGARTSIEASGCDLAGSGLGLTLSGSCLFAVLRLRACGCVFQVDAFGIVLQVGVCSVLSDLGFGVWGLGFGVHLIAVAELTKVTATPSVDIAEGREDARVVVASSNLLHVEAAHHPHLCTVGSWVQGAGLYGSRSRGLGSRVRGSRGWGRASFVSGFGLRV